MIPQFGYRPPFRTPGDFLRRGIELWNVPVSRDLRTSRVWTDSTISMSKLICLRAFSRSPQESPVMFRPGLKTDGESAAYGIAHARDDRNGLRDLPQRMRGGVPAVASASNPARPARAQWRISRAVVLRESPLDEQIAPFNPGEVSKRLQESEAPRIELRVLESGIEEADLSRDFSHRRPSGAGASRGTRRIPRALPEGCAFGRTSQR